MTTSTPSKTQDPARKPPRYRALEGGGSGPHNQDLPGIRVSRRREIDEVFSQPDVVSVHVRQSPDTLGLIQRKHLELMKPAAMFISTARGGIVKEPDLLDVLETRNAGAGLDVFEARRAGRAISLPPAPARRPMLPVQVTPVARVCRRAR